MEIAVSVIVPVYNVAPYIERCARSLFEQTLESLEILFIDDCSPDNSSEIIEKILEEYPNRVANTKILKNFSNAGQAGVRKRGILAASGRYIIHCDGDDWVDKNLYEDALNAAIKTDADIVITDEVREYADSVIPMKINLISSNGKEIIANYYKHSLGLFCHNKLVKKSLYLENKILPWDGLNMWEDNGLFARLFYHADKVIKINGPVYHYNRSNISAMTAGYGEKEVSQMINIAKNLTDFFSAKEDKVDYQNTVKAFQFLARINLITDSFKNYKKYKKCFVGSETIMKELDTNVFSSKGKIRFWMVKYKMPLLFVSLFKIKNLIAKR